MYSVSGMPSGSPPRVRGEGTLAEMREKRGRITPACAGRSHRMRSHRSAGPDHPRVCGEKFFSRPKLPTGEGSPPRVRGEVELPHDRVKQLRITPACAGRSRRSWGSFSRGEDHPRVCGEKSIHSGAKTHITGSPPRVRGEAYMCISVETRPRITPACAGRRPPGSPGQPRWWDHPRVCGEKMPCRTTARMAAGSPPRVRGEDARHDLNQSYQGITPACAGRSFVLPSIISAPPDHPRVCGEKFLFAIILPPLLGSPPRVRGED